MERKINNKVMTISLWAMAYGIFWVSIINNRLFNIIFGIAICLFSLYYYYKYKKELK